MTNMTTGLKAIGSDVDCDLPSCLGYAADAGAEWSYMNAPYSLLQKLLAKATGKSFEAYCKEKIETPLGMNGSWFMITDFVNVYQSNTRSAARFGLLMLNKGKWMNRQIVSPEFISTQTSSSQNINPAYGLLTWLNGKSSYMIPGVTEARQGAIVPSAPADMFYAWGRDDQKIYIVPSLNIVVVRLGQSASPTQAETPQFDDELWQKLKAVFNY
jgi:CubicO group peptidase (beta-lactamase class C family)